MRARLSSEGAEPSRQELEVVRSIGRTVVCETPTRSVTVMLTFLFEPRSRGREPVVGADPVEHFGAVDERAGEVARIPLRDVDAQGPAVDDVEAARRHEDHYARRGEAERARPGHRDLGGEAAFAVDRGASAVDSQFESGTENV
jgi:hypothetical protein